MLLVCGVWYTSFLAPVSTSHTISRVSSEPVMHSEPSGLKVTVLTCQKSVRHFKGHQTEICLPLLLPALDLRSPGGP